MSPPELGPAAVVLAAGAGSRLGALAERHSKATVPILGRPLADWVAERLHQAGCTRLIFVAHPQDTYLQHWASDRADRPQVVVQPQRRGIADALLRAQPALDREEAYLACACDSLFEVDDLRAVVDRGRAQPGCVVLGTLRMGREATAQRSAVVVDGDRLVRVVEKPKAGTVDSPLVAAPLYWLPRSIAPFLEGAAPIGGESHVSTAINDFVRAGGDAYAHPLRSRLEVTRAGDVEVVERALRRERSSSTIR